MVVELEQELEQGLEQEQELEQVLEQEQQPVPTMTLT